MTNRQRTALIERICNHVNGHKGNPHPIEERKRRFKKMKEKYNLSPKLSKHIHTNILQLNKQVYTK